jgi:hypothetical protein
VDAVDQLERGRASYAGRKWIDAYESLSDADLAAPLEAEDLELLATSAYMLGRDDEYVRAIERAHRLYLGAGDALRTESVALGSRQRRVGCERGLAPRKVGSQLCARSRRGGSPASASMAALSGPL